MSLSEEKKILLSQLVDGELPVDEANRALAEVFDDLAHVLGSSESAKQLHAMLQLRRAFDPWRRQEPVKSVVTPAIERAHHRWSMLSLASAALVGGILVAGGFFLGGLYKNMPQDVPLARPSAVVVTPEQRRDIAQAFALHESVAGPLGWYAADDTTIQVAPAEQGETLRMPIAVVLRLSRVSSLPNGTFAQPKTYVIVCRNSGAATIELPSSPMAPNLRLRLISTVADGQVKLQYALAAAGSARGLENAALVGGRRVGLDQTSLGQLALNDRLVNVDASAWVLANHN
jgi:hypothetical protein